MKRHVQTTGVRQWAGGDLIDLQAEPLKTIDAFFKEYGSCIVQGCEISQGTGATCNIAPGLVALEGTDHSGQPTFKVVPFAGIENQVLPAYLTLTFTTIERTYTDQNVKPIAYDYKAEISSIRPSEETPFLEITEAGSRRFTDAIRISEKLDKTGNGRDVTVTFPLSSERTNVASGEKLSVLWSKVSTWFAALKAVAFSARTADLTDDATHRLTTDTEKANWNDKYTRAETDTANTATNNAISNLSADVYHKAETYNRAEIDGKDKNVSDAVNDLLANVYRKTETYNRSETDNKDAATLAASKQYVLDRVAEVIGSSPTALDTLYEIAAALGNDPNFATSIMALIGEKANTVHNHAKSQITDFPAALPAVGGHSDSTSNLLITDQKPTWGNGLIINQQAGAEDAPNSEFFNYLRLLHGNPSGWLSEIAMTFTGNDEMFFRTMQGGTFKPWHKIAFTTDIPNTLPANGGNADSLDGHHYNQFIHVVASNSIQAEDTDGSFCGFGYVANGFPTNGSLISFGGLGNEGKFITQIQANYDGGNEIYFRTRNNNAAGNPITSSWKRLARADEIPTTTDQIAETATHFFLTPAERATITAQGIQIGTLANYDSYTETGKYYVFDVPGGPNWQNAAYFVILEVEKLLNGGIYQTAKSSFIGDNVTTSGSIESYSRAYTASNDGHITKKWTTWKINGNEADIQTGEKASYDDYTETGKYYVYDASNGPGGGAYFNLLEVEKLPNGAIYQTCKSSYMSDYSSPYNGEIYINIRAYIGDDFYSRKIWTSWRRIYPCSSPGSPTPTIADQFPPSDPPTATPALPPTATPTTTE